MHAVAHVQQLAELGPVIIVDDYFFAAIVVEGVLGVCALIDASASERRFGPMSFAEIGWAPEP